MRRQPEGRADVEYPRAPIKQQRPARLAHSQFLKARHR